MSISDFLDEYFETDVIKANFAISGIIGTALGPMSPGTAYVLLHHYMGEVDGSVGAWGYARGGMGAVTKALAASLPGRRAARSAPAPRSSRCWSGSGKADGVVLAGGEEIYGKLVVSNADVKRTFLKLVEEKELPDIFLRRVKNFKIRGSSGKVNIALDSLPEFPALPKDSPVHRGDLHFTDSVERMERAYDDWKAGRWSADPVPRHDDPDHARPDHGAAGQALHELLRAICAAQGRGPRLDRCRPRRLRRKVIAQIADYSPGFRDRILHMEVRTPREIEAEVGLTEGNIFQGELTFDQLLFNRPVPGYAQYRSPVGGLYMCGSSTHPGGGVMGAPGRNAAARDPARPRQADATHMSAAHDVI